MNKLNKNIPAFSMVLMMAGLILFVFFDVAVSVYIFFVGAVLLGISRVVSMAKRKQSNEVTRLPQIRLLSVAFLLFAGYLMYDGSNSWSILLLVSAILELYVTFRQKK